MSEQLEQNPAETVELDLQLVRITRDNSKIAVEVPAHEIPILEVIHTPENVEVIESPHELGSIEVSADAAQELLRLRNKYDQKNDSVVQVIYPRGERDLVQEGFSYTLGAKAERPVRAQNKQRPVAKKAAKKK